MQALGTRLISRDLPACYSKSSSTLCLLLCVPERAICDKFGCRDKRPVCCRSCHVYGAHGRCATASRYGLLVGVVGIPGDCRIHSLVLFHGTLLNRPQIDTRIEVQGAGAGLVPSMAPCTSSDTLHVHFDLQQSRTDIDFPVPKSFHTAGRIAGSRSASNVSTIPALLSTLVSTYSPGPGYQVLRAISSSVEQAFGSADMF